MAEQAYSSSTGNRTATVNNSIDVNICYICYICFEIYRNNIATESADNKTLYGLETQRKLLFNPRYSHVIMYKKVQLQ